MKRHWQLYFVVLIPMLYVIIFKYVPMYGALIAFKDYHVVQGILGSPWAGLKHFEYFFNSPNFWPIFNNTLGISLYALAVGFPVPIALALALNEVRQGAFKRLVQMVTYAPYFISTVIMVSIVLLFLDPHVGIVNMLIQALGYQPINFMGTAGFFKTIYVLSDVWQNAGYAAIIYIAALAGINTDLYEAARVDGASRFQKMLHVDLPGIMPVAVVMLILSVGGIMNVGFEKIYLMQNQLNVVSSEVIATYVYKEGLLGANFSFSAAVGLFNSVINVILLVTVNQVARRYSENSLW
ncbi:ABC transporter permease [Cohnella zeiphila]|uniref:Sugar ABC transporter permease n=1 Tax=Cohnella zeiphila TaxID=2761120 RepID=A0A7X0STA3_9BACL|nr:ABC transporter permease subunit [Cohnella zeiphila]MBB6734744.1 sugar ABC transporter permease [Cohnella zeiphila]